MYKIIRYSNSYKEKWDSFIDSSKNGTFLLKRNYMEYHKERFPDTSFVIFDSKDNIKAVIAGTISEDTYFSHKGLTYGGWIIDCDSKVSDVIEYFDLLNKELKEIGIKEVIYKKIPYIYCKYPSDEDEYILFNKLASKVENISISSTIDLQRELKFNKSRKSSISKSKRYSLVIEKNQDEKEFWKILEENLMKTHNTSPVHTLEEIIYLKDKFPENIEIFIVKRDGRVVAGAVMYITEEVVHVQYISSNEEGKEISALDYLFNYLIKENFRDKKYFDFGTSTENGGKVLNKGLIFQKEGFGARGVNYIQYRYKLEENK